MDFFKEMLGREFVCVLSMFSLCLCRFSPDVAVLLMRCYSVLLSLHAWKVSIKAKKIDK